MEKEITLASLDNENRFAKVAVGAVIEKLGKLYNPLYLYGDNLAERERFLSAICNEIAKNEKLALECIKAENMQDGNKDADVLLIYDLDKIEENAEKQKEILDTLNIRLKEQQQIIFFAQKQPKDLQIDERLKSRLTWGLIVEIR